MFDFASPEDLAQSFGVMDKRDIALHEATWTPTIGAYTSAVMEQSFDRTSGARAWEWGTTVWANLGAEAGQRGFATEEEYKASELYNKNIPFEAGMTETTLKIRTASSALETVCHITSPA